jgi:hypothetical protein
MDGAVKCALIVQGEVMINVRLVMVPEEMNVLNVMVMV